MLLCNRFLNRVRFYDAPPFGALYYIIRRMRFLCCSKRKLRNRQVAMFYGLFEVLGTFSEKICHVAFQEEGIGQVSEETERRLVSECVEHKGLVVCVLEVGVVSEGMESSMKHHIGEVVRRVEFGDACGETLFDAKVYGFPGHGFVE